MVYVLSLLIAPPTHAAVLCCHRGHLLGWPAPPNTSLPQGSRSFRVTWPWPSQLVGPTAAFS